MYINSITAEYQHSAPYQTLKVGKRGGRVEVQQRLNSATLVPPAPINFMYTLNFTVSAEMAGDHVCCLDSVVCSHRLQRLVWTPVVGRGGSDGPVGPAMAGPLFVLRIFLISRCGK